MSHNVSKPIRRRIVIVGIPGVGKSTVVGKTVDLMTSKGLKTIVVNFGTVMMEEATRLQKVRSRDDMRKLPIESQRKLQVYAASRISKIRDPFVIVDTHLFIATREGFWPGMPLDVIRALKPTHLVLVSASVEEIEHRRENDKTRSRDVVNKEGIKAEVEAANILLFASSLVCGCPALVINNSDGQIDTSAQSIIDSVFSS